MLELQNKHIVLGVTGGIAAYKAAELCRQLQTKGASVQVIMTNAACEFITPLTMQALSGKPVYTSQWDLREYNAMSHINLTRNADLIIIAPASADFMAQLAQGFAGELLPLLCLARPHERCDLLIAPAMNKEMWLHPATQRNVKQIAQDGAIVLTPASGEQACGEVGQGRMPEPVEIVDAVLSHFTAKVLQGKKVLITAGPTFEPMDPVRGITNHSSGKMGFAIAAAAQRAGADVTLIAGPVSLPTPTGVKRTNIQTAQQMLDAVQNYLNQQKASHMPVDLFIACAAVADWRPAKVSDTKIKKQKDSVMPQIDWVENPDILATIASQENAPYCVGFAAESHDLLRLAQEKRIRKGIPLIVGNIGPDTFGKDHNALLLIDEHGHQELPHGSKADLARELIAKIAKRLNA